MQVHVPVQGPVVRIDMPQSDKVLSPPFLTHAALLNSRQYFLPSCRHYSLELQAAQMLLLTWRLHVATQLSRRHALLAAASIVCI